MFANKEVNMSDQNLDYVAIGRNVEKSMEGQKRLYRMIFFLTHLILFLVTMFTVWGIALTNSQLNAALFNSGLGAALILILPTVMWAFAILAHVSFLYIESEAGEKTMREKLLMSEIGEEILRKGLTDAGLLEKTKRRAAALQAEQVRLSDDGELLPADEEQRPQKHDSIARTNNAGHS